MQNKPPPIMIWENVTVEGFNTGLAGAPRHMAFKNIKFVGLANPIDLDSAEDVSFDQIEIIPARTTASAMLKRQLQRSASWRAIALNISGRRE